MPSGLSAVLGGESLLHVCDCMPGAGLETIPYNYDTLLMVLCWNSLGFLLPGGQGAVRDDEEDIREDEEDSSPTSRELVTVTPYVLPNPGPYPQVCGASV